MDFLFRIKTVLLTLLILAIENLAFAETKQLVFDLTGSFHGYGDVTGAFWTILELKKLLKKEKEDLKFSIILDGRSSDILNNIYPCSSLKELEKKLGLKFLDPEEVASQPKADYLFQLFHGGRQIESFDRHPLAVPNTAVIISDTMHGTKMNEVRIEDRHYYFKPPGIGSERSGIITSPDILRFQKKSNTERKAIVWKIVKKIPSISKIQSLFQKQGPYSGVRFSFLYGIHNEILHKDDNPELQGQTKKYIETLQEVVSDQGPILVFTPNKPEQIKQTMSRKSVNILNLDDIYEQKPLENKIYFVSTGDISSDLFTGLMSISDFPVLVEGNSAISTAIRLNIPFIVYRSLWNKPHIQDIVQLEKDANGTCYYEQAYTIDNYIPLKIGKLLQALSERLGSGETQGEAIAKVMSDETKELSRKLALVIKTIARMNADKDKLPSLAIKSKEPICEKIIDEVLHGDQDPILAYSILKEAFSKKEVSHDFYRRQRDRLIQGGVKIDDFESKLVPNTPNFSIKFEELSGLIASDKEEAQTKKILSELQGTPKRNLHEDPQVSSYLQNHKIYVSMTTSPGRIKKIHHVLDSLDLDHVEKVLISLPKRFGRDKCEYTIPENIRNHPKVKILTVPLDYGPITKMIPAIGYAKSKQSKHGEDSMVISVDDDIGYPRGSINELIYKSVKTGNSVVSGSGYDLPNNLHSEIINFPRSIEANDSIRDVRSVDMVEGWGAIAYPIQHVDLHFLKGLSNISNACFVSDDLVISFALALDKVPRYRISNEYLRWEMLKPLPYGEKEDALHRGAGLSAENRSDEGGGNRKKYKECFDQLMRVAFDEDKGAFRNKEEILQKINELSSVSVNRRILKQSATQRSNRGVSFKFS